MLMNRLLGIGGLLVVLGGLVMLIIPGPPIPLLDANRIVLAESIREGYCTGNVYSDGVPQEESAADCRATSSLPDEIDLPAVQRAACQGYADSYNEDAMWVSGCADWMAANQFWPTMDGRLTNSWNRRFPYPLNDLGIPSTGRTDNDRGGSRDGNNREDGLR